MEKRPFFTHGLITLQPSESGLTSDKSQLGGVYTTFNHFSSWFNLILLLFDIRIFASLLYVLSPVCLIYVLSPVCF